MKHDNPARARMRKMLTEHREKRKADEPRRKAFRAHMLARRFDEARKIMRPEEWTRHEAHEADERRRSEHETTMRARVEAAEALSELRRRAETGDVEALKILAEHAARVKAAHEKRSRELREAQEAERKQRRKGASNVDLAAALEVLS